MSNDNGNNWLYSGLTGDTVSSLTISGTNIFAGIISNISGTSRVYISTNNGGTWLMVNNGLTNLPIFTIANNDTNIFAGAFCGGVFLSTNNGNSWIAVNNGFTSLCISSIVTNGNNIFVGTSGGGVFLSNNNGVSWTAVNTGLNTYVDELAVSGSNIFSGTDGGVFFSTNNGSSWTAVNNNGLTYYSSISSIAIKGNYIYVGTNTGHGIYKRPLSEFVAIKENFVNTNMLYPNPTKGKFTITQTNNIKSIEIYNVMGEIVYKSQASNSKTQIDISAQPKGIYIVKINNGVNTQIEKIVLQ